MRRSLFILIVLSFITHYSFGVNASWNYTVTTGTSSPISMTGATTLGLDAGDYDDGVFSLAWPFAFQIYDDIYSTSNTIYGNTDGYLRFDGYIHSTAKNSTIPTNSNAFGQFLSWGGNQDGKISSNIQYKVTGTSPNRVLTFAFTWYSYYYYNSSHQHADIQISFYEANKNIKVDYSNVGGTASPSYYTGMNAGDNVFGNDLGQFPLTAKSYTFVPGSAISAPTAFSATTASSCQNNLTWTKNSLGSDVIVAYNTTNSFGTPASGTSYSVGGSLGSATILYIGSATSTTHTNLLPGTSYYYKVWSKSSSNIYSQTGLTDNATTHSVLNTTNFTATGASSTQVNLTWNLNTYNDNVIVTYNTVNSFSSPQNGTSYNVGSQIGGQQTVLYKGSATSFSHTGLTVNTPYYYKIWSYGCQDYYSTPGQTSNTTTQSTSNPTAFTATASSTCNINLSWTKNSSSNNVMVLANTSNTFGTPTTGTPYTVGYIFPSGGQVIYNGSASSYSYTGLVDGTTYYFKAFSVDGSSNYSSGLSSNASTSTIADPASFSSTAAGTSQINLSWTKNTANDDVIITYNTSNSFATPTSGVSYTVGNSIAAGQGTVLYKGSLSSFNHTGLNISTTYYYKIWSYDCGLNYSAPGKTTNSQTSNISDPSNFAASASSSCAIGLSWTLNSSNDDVMVVYNTTNSFATPTNSTSYTVGYQFPANQGKVLYVGNATTYSHSGLMDNSTYYYKIFAVNSSNTYSSGTTANGTTPLIAAPASSSATANGATQINLTWAKNTAADDVIITYNTSNNFAAPTDGVTYTVGNQVAAGQGTVLYKGSLTNFSHTGLTFNTPYYYKFYSYDCGLNYSSALSSNATTANVTNAQSFSLTAASSCKVNISWTLNTSGDDVMIAYSTSNNFATPSNGVAYSTGYTFPFGQGTVAYVGSGTSYSHSPLFSNTKYYYKIWSKNSGNYYSTGILDSVTTSVLGAPASFTATASGTSSINLSWAQNTAGDDVIITYNNVNNFATPTSGLSYTVGNQIAPGQGIVLYKGSLTSFAHSGLNLNSTYYYKIWSYDCALSYSGSALTANATTGSVADPSSFTATSVSSSQINLAWAQNASSDDVMIAYNTTNSFASPANGITYVVGNQISSGQGTVLYIGSLTAFNHTALNMNTPYYYKIWSVDGSTNYSPGITANATTASIVDPATFSASMVSSSQIDLAWTQNASSDDVMIVYNTTNNFATPSNGTNYVLGNQIAAGQGTVLYKGSLTSFSHTGLSASTQYFYKAYSYNSAYYYSTPGKIDSATTDAPGVATFPYLEDFETQTSNQGNISGCVSYYPLTSGWNNVQSGDDIDWIVRSGTTPSGSFGWTGPAGDHTTGSGKYIYTEANSCYNKEAWLVSPLFNFSSLTTPRLEFYYHMRGTGMGSITVQASTNGGLTWSSTNLFSKSGQQQTSQNSAWGHADISLASYAGMTNLKFRIKGTTGFSWTSDMAVDDIRVFQPQNMSVTSVTTEQDTIDVVLGAVNQEVIRIKVTTVGAFSPLTLGQFALSTSGTQDVSDIKNAKIFYTANNPNFSTTQQVGSTIASMSGSFPITGNQVLAEGVNYFWLTYDIPSTATIGHVVDAQCTQVIINSATHVPTVTSPSGTKTIVGQITVGTGTSSSWNGPVYPAYYNGAHESIYLASEMGTSAKEINKIAWYKASGTNTTDNIDNIKIYMKNASGSSLSSGSYSLNNYTLVYQGLMPNYATSGWMAIPLSNTFLYDGTSNLHVLVVQTKPSTTWSNYPYYAYTTVSPNKARGAYNFSSTPSNLTATNRRPNAQFEYVLPQSMSYNSATVTQSNTANVPKGGSGQEIIGIQVETSNTSNPLSLTKLLLNTAGSTSASDISNAKIYYTGSNPTFSATGQFGATVVSPSGSFTVTGSQTLTAGTNYFWLAYDVSSSATVNNVLDARCDSITISGTTYAPTVNNPNGSRTIKDYIIVGTGTSSNAQQPLHYYQYHAWEGIYYASELGSAKDLSALSFYKASGSNTTNSILNVTIYLKHTTATSVSTGAYSTTSYTQVYSGSFPNNAPTGWMEVPFTNPFSYNGTDNIEVLIVQQYGAYFTGYPYWAYRTTTPNRARYANSFSSMPSTLNASNRLANIRFEFSDPAPQTYVSSTVVQNNTTNITAGVADQDILDIQVVAQNSSNPLSVTSFSLTTTGSSNPSTDISGAKIYYSGTSASFTTANQFGSIVSNPNGSFTITGSQTLSAGTNHFWLVYDIPATATSYNWVDATCTSITVAGSAKTPTVTSPIGNRTIVGALHGEYTIGSGGDYTSFTSAVNALNTYGVSSWVKFRVYSGTYTEQISLQAFNNASAANNVTFEAYTGDSSDVILTYGASSSASNYTINIDGGAHYNIQKMTIKASSNTYGVPIRISTSSSDINIKNNKIIAGSSTSTNTSGIYMYNVNVSGIEIKNNDITGGGYGLYIRGGSTSSLISGITIDSNIVTAQRYGAYLLYTSGLEFVSNSITSSGSTFTYGVYAYYNNNGFNFSNNIIISQGTSTAYGLYLRSSSGTSSNRNLVSNNFIIQSSTSVTNSAYGLNAYQNNYTDIVFNNIHFRGSSGNNKYAAFFTGGSNNTFKNNMVIASNGAPAVYVQNASAIGTSDYNNLYSTGNVLGYVGNTSTPNLTSWKSTVGEDSHSISSNPNFTSNTDLHVTNVALNNLGTPITGVTIDIDGDTRHATTPDIGADEFSVDIDAGITAILSPVDGCNGSQNAQVTIKNFGQNTITSATINWMINGTPQTAFSWTGSLATSQTANVIIGNVTLISGNNTVTAWTSTPNGQSDQLTSNDTTSVTVNIGSAPFASVGNDTTICSSVPFTTTGTASNYTTLLWSSSGSGAFSTTSALTTTYTPSSADISAGSVYLKLKASTSGCADSEDSLLLTLQAMSTVSFSGLSTTYCPNDGPSTLTGTPTGGVFSGPGISGNIFDPSNAGSGTHTIKYIYTLGGCVDSASQTTSVSPTLTPVISGLSAGYCVSQSADTLVGTPAGGTWSGIITSNIFDPATVGVGNHTVKYTVVDATTSCSFDTSYAVQVYSAPTASISGLQATYCSNDPIDTLLGSPAGGTFTGPGMSGNFFDPQVAGVGTHSIQYIINNGVGCSDTATQSVVVNQAPSASFTGLAATYCSTDAAVTLSGTPSGGTFSGNGITSNSFDPSAASIGVNVISYTVTASNGCTAVASQNTTVNQTPIANAGTDPTIVNGHDTILYGNATGGSGSYSYSWTPVNKLVTGNANMQNPTTVALNANEIYTLTVTDNNTSCSSTDQVEVIVTGGVFAVNVSANPLTICDGDSTQIQAVASGGGGNYSYLWSSSPSGYSSAFSTDWVKPNVTTTYTVIATDGTSFSSSSVVITVNSKPAVSLSGLSLQYCDNADSVNMIGSPTGGVFSGTGVLGSVFYPDLAGSGSYDLTYTYTNSNGCSNSDTFNVSINATPKVNAGSDVTINYNTDTILHGTAVNGGNYAWNWMPATKLISNTVQNPTTTILTQTQQYILNVTDTVSGCNDNDTVVVFISGGPLSAAASATPATICRKSTAQLSATPSGGNGTYSYVWTSVPAGFTSTQQNPVVNPDYTTTYNVTVVSGTQSVNASTTVTVNPLTPVTVMNLDTTYCNSAPGDTLIGLPASGVFGGAGMQGNVFDASLVGPGNHFITFTYTDPVTSCITDTILPVKVVADPLANAGSDVTILTGHDTILYGSATGGSGSYSYLWSPTSMVTNSGLAQTNTTILTATQQYNLSVTDNIYGCTNNDDVIVTVSGGTLTATANANPDTICAGETSQITALASGGSGSYTYSWSSNPSGFAGLNMSETVSPNVTTTYTVVVNDGTNSTSSSVVVMVNPTPTVSFTGLNASYCDNDAASTLVGSPTGGVFSGTGIQGSSFDPASVPNQGSYNITYSYTDPNTTCSASLSQNVTVYDAPIADAGSDVTIAMGSDTILYGNATSGANYKWAWNPPLMLLNASLQSPTTVALTATQLFTLTVTDSLTSCSDNDDVVVFVGNSVLSATIQASPSAICDGDSAKIDILTTGGTGNYTYSWTSIPAGFTSSTNSFYVKPNVTTLYSVTVDDGTNTVSKNITITVNPKPGIALVGLNPVHCETDLPDTLLGFPAGGTFSGAGITSNLFDPVSAGIGTHYISYTYTNSFGCSNTDIDTVDIYSNPISNAGIDVSIQTGHDTILYGNGNGGTGSYIFEWSPASKLLNAFAQNATTVSLNLTQQFVLKLSDQSTSCYGLDTVQVTVYGGTLVSNPVGQPDTICIGSSTQLNAMASGGTGLYNYLWSSSPAGFSSSLSNPVVTPSVTTTYTVITDDGSNTVVNSVVVVVETKPTVSITSFNANNCENGGFDTLQASPSGGIYFGTGISGNFFDPSVAGVGNHQIIYSYTTAGGCNNKDTITTQVIAAPVSDAGNDILIPCGGSGLIGSNPVMGMIYSWSPNQNLLTPNASMTVASPMGGTVYSLTTTDTLTGCSMIDDVLVDVIGGPTAVVANDTIICKGESVTLFATGGTSYQWSNGVTSNSFTISPNTSTTYTVTVSDGTCYDVDSVQVSVNAPYLFLGPDMVLIDTTSFVLDAGYGFLNYLWNTGDTTQAIVVQPYVNAALGHNTFGVAVVDAYGCIAVDSISISYVLGLENNDDNIKIDVYPNPNKGAFVLDIEGVNSTNYLIEIRDIRGGLLYQEQASNTGLHYTKNFDLRTYPKGVYMLRILNEGFVRNYKIIIQ